MLNNHKQPVERNFQLDDTADGHSKLTTYLRSFFEFHPDAELYAGLE